MSSLIAELDEVQASQRRAIIAAWLSEAERAEVSRRLTPRALAIAAADMAGYLALTAIALLPLPLSVSLAMALPIALAIGVLFVVGHDACHQAFTPSRRLNDWIARVMFVPAFHAASLWDLGHNRIHHVFTNLRGRDYVWVPMSPPEYRAASPLRRALYRLYRSPVGAAPYHFVEMLTKKFILPIAPEARPEWRRHLFDSLFVIAGNLVMIWAAAETGRMLAPERSVWLSVVIGWLLPFVLFNAVMGWTIYVHHTHPDVGWYDDPADWTPYRAQILSTVHSRYFQPLDLVANNIMEHNAHHLLPGIPCYNLRRAQAYLRRRFPRITYQTLNPATYLRSVNRCKLFDFEQRCWTDFSGRPTGPAIPLQPDPDLRR